MARKHGVELIRVDCAPEGCDIARYSRLASVRIRRPLPNEVYQVIIAVAETGRAARFHVDARLCGSTIYTAGGWACGTVTTKGGCGSASVDSNERLHEFLLSRRWSSRANEVGKVAQ